MIVYTGGTFDLFHVGHVELLKKCKELGEVIVSVNTDEFVLQYKGLKPNVCLEHRIEVLLACRYVDKVIVNEGGKDSKPSILCVKPDIIVVGDDWAPPKNYLKQLSVTQEWLDEHNIKLMFVPYCKKTSSSKIRASCEK